MCTSDRDVKLSRLVYPRGVTSVAIGNLLTPSLRHAYVSSEPSKIYMNVGVIKVTMTLEMPLEITSISLMSLFNNVGLAMQYPRGGKYYSGKKF